MKRMTTLRKYIDIGANLTDDMYKGIYHGSKKHEPDLDIVLNRAWSGSLDKMIITGGSFDDSRKAIDLSRTDTRLYTTVGCHPTRCNDFVDDPESYIKNLSDLIVENREKVVAIGECGLDYDRLNFCGKETQLKYFEYQLRLSKDYNLPLFLHCRAAADDLVDILSRNTDKFIGGVVHSFDGSVEALNKILSLGLHIGINGCSLRTEQNLEVASIIPKDKLMIETDSPWCEVKQTHPGYKHVVIKFPTVKKEKYSPGSNSQVKGRNEPVNIVCGWQKRFLSLYVNNFASKNLIHTVKKAMKNGCTQANVLNYLMHVLEILAAKRNEDIDDLAAAIYDNTNKLFFPKS